MNYVAHITVNTDAYEQEYDKVELNGENWLRIMARLERENPTLTSIVITLVPIGK